jgi:protein involved in polysaccharide export with SLBB domain
MRIYTFISVFKLCLVGYVALLSSCSNSSKVSDDVEAFHFQASNPQSPANEVGLDYKTNVGDSLEVFVLEDSSFNGKYTIRPSGDIIIPRLGRISASQLSLKQVEEAVQKELQLTQLKKATVIVDPVTRTGGLDLGVQSGVTVYISGCVAKTGRQFVPSIAGNSVTALQAVVNAGGFSSFANKKKSFLLRRQSMGGSQRITLNFSAIEDGTSDDVQLTEGDMIVVPQKMFGL